MRPVAPARAMLLIARLRAQRLWNMVARFSVPPPANQASRAATPARKRAGWVLSALVGIAMLASLVNVAHQSVLNMECYLEPSSRCVRVTAEKEARVSMDAAARELHAAPFHEPVAIALTMQLTMLFLVSVMLPLSSREIAAADWDLEWLVTLPARRSTLLWGRIFERTLVNPTGWIVLAPTCATIAWYSGFRWSAPLAGVLGAALLLPLAAMLRTLADTGLRMSLAPSQLRNLQAIMGILAMPFMYLAFAFGTMNAHSPVASLARAFPAWSLWTPGGVLVRALDAGTAVQAAPLYALLLAELALPMWGGMQLLRYQLRHGVVASGSREAGRKPKATVTAAAAPRTGLARLLPASPIKRRELRLLARDRNFLVQSVLLPLIIIGSQLLVSGSPAALLEMGGSAEFTAGMAFAIGSYMLMLSAFQTLNNEGQSLWMLYTFPRSIESVLREKAEFWAVLALVYPLLFLAAALWSAPVSAADLLGRFAVVLAGIPIFSVIAVSLGVFGCDPLSQDVRTKVKPSYLYLYMLLSGVYVYAVTSDEWAQKLVMIILTASLALALWQKARDQLPYLLDPVAAPPARVSTADGLIAAVLFFMLQGIFFLGLTSLGKVAAPEALVAAFSIAGLTVYAIMRLVFWLSKTSGVPALLQKNTGSALGWGVAAGVAATALGWGYLGAIGHLQLFPEAFADGEDGSLGAPLLFLLAVVAAPLCEEFIFRGLVFGGLRRSMGLAPAMLMSAALFAIVHPPVSMLPVFMLGLCAAYVYERTRALLAPVAVHAVYNGALLAFQMLQ